MDDDEWDVGQPTVEADGTPTHCATCETRLDSGTWHPTAGSMEPDGTYHIVRFCSDECHDAWDPERDEPLGT